MPRILFDLSNRQRYFVNNAISIAYISGHVIIDRNRHSSPHLKGQFLAQVRMDQTGILSAEPNIVREVSDEQFAEIKKWFSENNFLYQGNLNSLDLDEFIENHSKKTVVCKVVDQRAPNEVMADVILPDGIRSETIEINHKHEVMVKKRSDPKQVIWMSLESALPLMFPVLFPYGFVPLIPGSTLRQKAQNLLLSCDSVRNTGIGSQLILFLFDCITKNEFKFSKIQMQRLNYPSDGIRSFTPVPRAEDPSFSVYWAERESEIQAMTFRFGFPDLMLTFTLNNKWADFQEKSISLNQDLFGVLNRPLDPCYMPFESMKIWDSHFKNLSSKKFKDLCQFLGLGNAIHFVSRLEFQLRGAPHAHVLIWLEKPLSIVQIDQIMSAHIPDDRSPILKWFVTKNMIHNCVPSRCFRNPNHHICKYGFPKQSCEETCIDSTGQYCIKRNENESRVVEYDPLLLLLWKGHVHLMFLKTLENPDQISTTGHYVLKYNMKPEPSYEVNLSVDDVVFAQTRARVVSSEESIARIFSYPFCIHDVKCVHKGGAPPELRNAAYNVNGDQIQLDSVQIYYRRPLELERIGFADFWSWYKVIPAKENIAWEGPPPDFHRMRISNTLNPSHPNYSYEDNFILREDIKSPMPIFPDENLQCARKLVAIRRKKPIIVILNKYNVNSNREHYCFHVTFLSGCWRSDEEILANCQSFEEAAKYHGTFAKFGANEIDQFSSSFIIYMINSNRYHPQEIAKNICMLDPSSCSYNIEDIFNQYSTEFPQRIAQIRNAIAQFQTIDLSSIPTQSITDETDEMKELIGLNFSNEEKNEHLLELNNLVTMMNREQKIAFNLITKAIKDNDGNESRFFISGKAGTGKSFLINAIINYCIVNSKSFIVTASTGIAASLIGGQTFHSAFSIWPSPDGPISTLNISNHRGLAMSKLQVIIVDEVTMLDRLVLNSASKKLIEISEKCGNRIEVPFAGKTVIFFGDPSQVPAVTNSHDDMSECAEQFMNIAGFSGFIPLQLKKMMRQNDPDQESFRKLLEEVSRTSNGGILSNASNIMLKGRFFSEGLSLEQSISQAIEHAFPDSDTRKSGGMIITYTNDRANTINLFALGKIVNNDNPKINIVSIVKVSPNGSYQGRHDLNMTQRLFNQTEMYHERPATEHEKNAYLNAQRRGNTKCTVPFYFQSAIGARVMLMRNVNIKSKLTNGARGIVVGYVIDGNAHVTHISRENMRNQILAILVKFDFQSDSDQPIEITRRIVNKFKSIDGLSYEIYQFPLRLAWAVTAHKSQGQTLNKVSIDIGTSAFAHGALYVALSRVRKISDILFFGTEKWPENGIVFHVNDFIQQQSKALNDEADHIFAQNIQNDENHSMEMIQ